MSRLGNLHVQSCPICPIARILRLASLAPGVPKPLPGFDYPAPRHPAYLRQERCNDLEELMPLARSHLQRRYGRSALGDIRENDDLLIVTFPHQNDMVFDVMKRALLERGAARVDRINTVDLGMEEVEYSAADGWREITDRLPPMIESGVEFNVAAAALEALPGRSAGLHRRLCRRSRTVALETRGRQEDAQ